MNRKGQSLSINTIIIAAIGLAVLVVLFAIFTGRLGIFTRGVQDTDTCQQKCASLNMDPGNNPLASGATECTNREEQYIAGSYKNAPNGCCCAPKIS